jgi:hypothetical protein
MKILLSLVLLFLCPQKPDDNYYLSKIDNNGNYFYIKNKTDTLIPIRKYLAFYTDTFRDIAIVSSPSLGFIAINRQQKILFNVFPYDNGPDYISDGYYRIVKNKKIGYADKKNSIKISPQFGCAYPFKNGKAKVSYQCTSVTEGEHSYWVSKNWFFINKKGKTIGSGKK